MSNTQLLGIFLLMLAAFMAVLHSKRILPDVAQVIIGKDYPGVGLLQFTVAVITLLVALSVLPKKSGGIVAALILFGGISVNQRLVDSGTLAGPSLLDSLAGN